MPENQTACNSNNQGIKETVNQTNQTNQTSKMAGQREPEVRRRQRTARAGLAEQETDSELTVDYSGGCGGGETPSLTSGFAGEWG